MSQENQLSYLNDEDRLKAYQTITNGCTHIWSKGKLQEDRLFPVIDTFISLAEKDPYFLAHFTSYALNKLDSKDLKVVSTFINALSDADGTPFSEGSNYKKPNLRSVSHAALQQLDPKLVNRVIKLTKIKRVMGSKKEGTHFPRSLKTSVKKYLRYRENNPKAIEGIRKVGLANTYKNLYRDIHLGPTDEAASILGWQQKERKIDLKKEVFNFKGLSDIEIANKIRDEKLPPTGALGALPRKISPVIAASILEQTTGDQAVILRELFDKEGLLKHEEVKKVFKEKIKTAKTALDRVERINTEIDEDIQKSLKEAKSTKRKDDVGDIGSIFLHLDVSSSMERAMEVTIDRGAIISECIKDPEKNFHWGLFNDRPKLLDLPVGTDNKPAFEKDAFAQALYGVRAGGMTDCIALYKKARELGCEIDIYITDQGHNIGNISARIEAITRSGLPKPKAAVIVNVDSNGDTELKDGLISAGIPVSELSPEALKESALVSQAVRTALKGASATIDAIMEEPLLKLPNWWYSVK